MVVLVSACYGASFSTNCYIQQGNVEVYRGGESDPHCTSYDSRLGWRNLITESDTTLVQHPDGAVSMQTASVWSADPIYNCGDDEWCSGHGLYLDVSLPEETYELRGSVAGQGTGTLKKYDGWGLERQGSGGRFRLVTPVFQLGQENALLMRVTIGVSDTLYYDWNSHTKGSMETWGDYRAELVHAPEPGTFLLAAPVLAGVFLLYRRRV
jgi:hypothetical protein